MFRKKLTPSLVRRCAIFLTVGGALSLNGARAQGGLALERSADDQAGVFVQSGVGSPQPLTDPSTPTQSTASAAKAVQITNPSSLSEPDLTGKKWFHGLQDGVDQAFVAQDNLATTTATSQKDSVNSLDTGVKANAIPSLPSFWSGLSCCLALMVVGMFPRVRRAFR